VAAAKTSFIRKDDVPPYAVGLRIPFSGIYEVRHENHRRPHEITLLQGQFFPACRTCGKQVTFVPVHLADRLREDYDFNEKIGFPTMGR
jgi:hypothetical protein